MLAPVALTEMKKIIITDYSLSDFDLPEDLPAKNAMIPTTAAPMANMPKLHIFTSLVKVAV